MKISEAIYRRGKTEEIIKSSMLDRDLYYSKYRGYLFCPEMDCEALLCFVERKKNGSSFFRTWSKKEHKEGCPFEVNYKNVKDEINRTAGEQFINITDRHIYDKLMRTYEQILAKEDFIKVNKFKPIRKKIRGKLTKPKKELDFLYKGKAEGSEREPYILTRRYSELDDQDNKRIRCVFGEINSMEILKSHAYINLTPKIDKCVKIYFSEHFKKDNEYEFQKLFLVKKYIDNLIYKTKLRCCCIGKIKKVKNGYNIHPKKINGFIINGFGFYDLIQS